MNVGVFEKNSRSTLRYRHKKKQDFFPYRMWYMCTNDNRAKVVLIEHTPILRHSSSAYRLKGGLA